LILWRQLKSRELGWVGVKERWKMMRPLGLRMRDQE